jgi:poly-gamma-glutamate synthesis protein (capsule biosynthesis protein)
MTATLLAVGDLILSEPEPDRFFELVAPTLHQADVVIGQVEVPYTRVPNRNRPDIIRDPGQLQAMANAGFTVGTMAGNHVFDLGQEALDETREALTRYGIVPVGAGRNLEEARQPAIVERQGMRFGILSYNCAGPKSSWASEFKGGAAYVEAFTVYQDLSYPTPGAAPVVRSACEHTTLESMIDDIEALRPRVDALLVVFHKGIGHTPARVADYERQVAHAAIRAGADVVTGHHAHILRGIEVYRGKPIYHGLGNFVAVTRALAIRPGMERDDWARQRREHFGFEPDPETPHLPWHPEARNTMIASLSWDDDLRMRAALIPCFINKLGQPQPFGNDRQGQQVLAYIEHITEHGRLNARYCWDGDQVLIDLGA